METIKTILEISIVISIFLIIGIIILIFVTTLLGHKIIKYRVKKIKENRKEYLKIILQDRSLFIQVLFGFGIALLLFSMSLQNLKSLGFGLMGLILIFVAFFILYWSYLPVRFKLVDRYIKEKNKIKKKEK